MKYCWQWLALLCLLMPSSVIIADETKDRVQQPDRSFGYTLGDVLEQRISLHQQTDHEQWQKLIPLQRVDEWIERQSVNIVDNGQWLVLRYQIVNSPTELVVAYLPAFEFLLSNEQTVNIESWPFSIAPLVPANTEQSAVLPLIQADWQPIAPDTLSAVRNLRRLVAAMLATLLVWLLWWLWQNRTDATHLPFARAYHDLRKLDKQIINEEQEAWILMHRAFNETAGRAVSAGSVDRFIKQYIWLQPLDTGIRKFYTESAKRFFAESAQTELFDIQQLCKALYRAEKKHVSGLKTNNRKIRQST